MIRYQLKALAAICCIIIGHTALAQSAQVTLPGFTAYAAPQEEGVHINERRGVAEWTDSANTVNFYFHVSTPGSLKIALQAKADGTSKVQASVNGVDKTVTIPAVADFTTIPVLETKIKKTGFYSVSLKGLNKSGKGSSLNWGKLYIW